MSQVYQSRVFTFLGNRTNQLKNTCAEGLRKLKVVVIWSGQVLLYPLLVAQQKIFPPKIVSAPSSGSFAQLVPDIDIEAALDLVTVAGYPIQVAGKSSPADDWSFIDENLWHTGYGNTQIDGREIAYRPRGDRQVTPPQPMIRGLCSLLADRQLVLVGTKNELVDILSISYQQELRRRIGMDLAIAWHEWHSAQLPEAESDHIGDTRFPLSHQYNTDRDFRSPSLLNKLRNWFDRSTANPTHEDRSAVESASAIASISPQRLLAPSPYSVTLRQPSFNRYFDLPQLPPIIDTDSSTMGDRSVSIVANITNRLQPDWLKSWWNYYREYLYIPSETDGLIDYRSTEFTLTPIAPTPSKIKSNSAQISPTSKIKIDAKFLESLEGDRDWIDTEAETIGYSRSLLARILAWIDRLVLAIENWLINVFASFIS